MKRLIAFTVLTGFATPALAGMAAAGSGPWDGFYAGVVGGGAAAPFYDYVYDGYYGGNAVGLLIGGEVGYSFHLSDKVVGGIEADLAWQNVTGAGFQWPVTYSIGWDASIRGTLGADLGKWMPYLTGGFAFAHTHSNYSSTNIDFIKLGPTVGAGLAFVVNDTTTAKVEFRHSEFGKDNYGYDLDVTENSVRAALDFHF